MALTRPPCCPQELYQRCERMRPTLFRLASDTEDNDEALGEPGHSRPHPSTSSPASSRPLSSHSWKEPPPGGPLLQHCPWVSPRGGPRKQRAGAAWLRGHMGQAPSQAPHPLSTAAQEGELSSFPDGSQGGKGFAQVTGHSAEPGWTGGSVPPHTASPVKARDQGPVPQA